MSSFGSPSPFFLAGKKVYEIERSLRFNDDDTAYLYRTQGTPTSDKIGTYSTWFKLANLGIDRRLRMSFTDGSNYGYLRVHSDNTLQFLVKVGGNTGSELITTQVLRDVSAWYHVVLAVDTTQSTASDRVKIYLNGTQITSFSTETYFSQNQVNSMFSASGSNQSTVGSAENATVRWDGYLAEVNNIDGQQLTPSSFGETDATTGQWIPKDTSGLTFGTNGFRLQFLDNSGTTATTLGKDTSGNSNNFTPSGFSVAAGAGNDSLEDTPTNNFCTLNGIALGQGNEQRATLSNGNLDFTESSSSNRTAVSTFGLKTGKWYFEFLSTNTGTFSLGWHDMENNQGSFYRNNGSYSSSFGGGGTSGYASWTTNDIVGVAIDFDSGKIWYAKNNTWQSGDPATGNSPTNTFTTGRTLHTEAFTDNSSGTKSGSFNYGQRPFTYTPPTGYKSLCTANLPDPTILLPNKHFDTLLYTGTDSAANRTLSGLNFSPDWVWQKRRNGTNWHGLHDSVRGGGKTLFSNDTSAEANNNQYGYLSAFTSDGFTWSAGSTNNSDGNETGGTFVSWCWNGGDTDGVTYTVKVVSDSGNKYRFNDFGTSAVTLDLAEGGTYIFDQSDSSNAGHPLRFYTAADKTGGEYTTGVTTAGTPGSSGAYTQIVVAASAPTLYYQCSVHAGMGGQANTNSTLGSSNFDGTIQSVVKANTTSGFSIVTYTGNSIDGATVGHGLGVEPSAVIIKSRNLGTIGSAGAHWSVSHQGITGGLNGGSSAKRMFLSLNNAESANAHGAVSAASSTVVTFKDGTGNSDDAHVNNSSGNYVAYFFSEVAGYSKFGSYTGNGSSDGTFVFTGFRPAFVIIKSSSLSVDWDIVTADIPNYNVVNKYINANNSAAESTYTYLDFVSNGFKLRNTGNTLNQSAATYIYLAFAESPFKNARAR